MKRIFLIVFTLLSYFAFAQPTLTTYDSTITGTGTGSGVTFNVRITRSTTHWSDDSVQAIIFVVGLGQMNTTASGMTVWGPHAALLNGGWNGSVPLGNGTHYPIIITIQPPSYAYAIPNYMKTKIDALLGRFKIKRNSVHLTGLSQGGWSSNLFVTYQATTGDYSYARMIASVVNVQGVVPSDNYGATPAYATRFRYWALYGHGGTGGAECGFEQKLDGRDIKKTIDTMNAARAGSGYYQQTNYGSGGHSDFDKWYGGSAAPVDTFPITAGVNYSQRQNIYKWMLRQGDTVNTYHTSTGNIPPVVNAGTDKVITLPTSSVTLTGSATDADGTISSYAWSKVSGPATYTINAPAAATTAITGLIAGTYKFKLTATDNGGASKSDTAQVTVNPAPPVVKYVNVNIYGGTNPYSNAAWNDWNVGASAGTNINSSVFNYSTGTASAISASLSQSAAVGDNGSSYGSGMAPAEVLRYTSYNTSNRTLTLNGLDTSKTYSIELYASRGANSGEATIFKINSLSDTVLTYQNLTSKAIFTNLTPNSTGHIIININRQFTYTYVNGFAITETQSSPLKVSGLPTVTAQSISIDDADKPVKTTEFTIAPNPVHDHFLLQINNKLMGKLQVQIVDINGRPVKTFNLVKDQKKYQKTISLNNISSGNYIVQAQIGNWRKSIQLVKIQ